MTHDWKIMVTRIFQLCLLSIMLWMTSSHASTKPPSEALGSVYQKVLNDPANLDLLYEYAHAAIEEGNFEIAVGALESMLVITSNQPRVLLELGVLYHRLGSPQVANTYLQRAKELAGEGSQITVLANEYLGELKQLDSPHYFKGFVRFGFRYQSNPTLSPERSEILSSGLSVPMPDSRKKDSDVNAFLLSRLNHRYRLSSGTSLASDLLFYGTAYDDNDELNFNLLELTSGPIFESPRRASGQHSFRPHLILRGSSLDGHLYEKTAGLGLDFKISPDTNSQFRSRYQFRDVNYDDFKDHQNASLRDGDEHRVELNYLNEFKHGHMIQVGLFARLKDAKRDYLEVDQYDISLRYSLRHDNFLFQKEQRMTLTPYIIRRFRDFGAPDPFIAPNKTRSDKEWRLGLNYKLPVSPEWALLMDMEYSEADSNIVNYDVENKLFMISLQKGF
ncbi:MAG: DUF2860 family protein [Gammaproteobacteria bacterium]|nr:DUF2860 family protein [Gammaproteobacteria bacterium]